MKGHVTAECRELLPCGSWSHICAPTCFQPQGCCPVIGQVRPQVRGRPYLQRHEFFCFTLITRATKNPKSAVIKTFTLLRYLQTGPTLSDVTCCVRLHNLLYVDAELQSLQPVKLLATCKRAHQLPTMLCPFPQGLSTRATLG